MSPLRLPGRRGELLELYRRMVLVRAFEAATGRQSPHDDAGSEIVVAGAAAALGAEDYVVTSDRPYRFALARGIEPEVVTAGLLGDARARGCWRIVGGGLRAATDLAPALARGEPPRGLLCVPGTAGALQPAAVHRALDIAASRRLPVVFVVRGDGRGSARAAERVDGDDAGAVHEATSRLLEQARLGQGPAALEVAIDCAPVGGVPPDPLSVTAVALAELGAEPEQLLAIAGEADKAVATAVERVSANAVTELIRAASPA